MFILHMLCISIDCHALDITWKSHAYIQHMHIILLCTHVHTHTHVHRTTLQVIGGQWINQSFNAMVNYTNRNAKSKITDK